MPISVRLARDQVVQVPGGRLIGTGYVHKIAQIKRCSSGRRCQEHVAYIFRAFELCGCVNQDISRLGLDDSTWSRHIPRVQDVFDLRRLQLQRCQPCVRVLQIDLFGQNAHTLDLRYLWYTLQRALDQVGEVIQLSIRIAVVSYFRDAFLSGLRVANDNRTPGVGMKVVLLELLLDELLSIRADFVIRLRRRKVDSGAASYGQRKNIVCEPVPFCLRSQHDKWPLNYSRRHGCRVTVENGDTSTRNSLAHFLNRAPHTARTQRDLQVRDRRTGDGQHQRSRVSEIADPGDRSRTIRKVSDLIQPLANVLEFLLSVLDVVQESDLHYRNVVLGG